MTKDHWIAATFITLGALILTNAAGYYSRQALKAQIAELEERNADTTTPDSPKIITGHSQPTAQTLRALPSVHVEGDPNVRCIDGLRFRITKSKWAQLPGTC